MDYLFWLIHGPYFPYPQDLADICYLPPKKLGKGNVFTGVSVHSGVGISGATSFPGNGYLLSIYTGRKRIFSLIFVAVQCEH